MNVDLMRRIDHWVGVPITGIMTAAHHCLSIFRSNKKTTPQRILFIELSEMGSTIIADPAMRKARDQFQATLYFVIFKKNKPSLTLLNTVKEENIFTIRDDGLLPFITDTFKFIRWCRNKQIDTTIDLELFSRATAILTGLSGAKNKVGYYKFNDEGLYRGGLLTHRVQYNPHLHMAKNFIALVNALTCKATEVPYSKTLINDSEITLPLAKIDSTKYQTVLKQIQTRYIEYRPNHHQIILINPNASELLPQRRWPLNQYAELIQRLLSALPTAVVLITGSNKEFQEAEQIRCDVNHPRCINFAGATRFSQLPALYALANLMVTNDSGPGHFSAVTRLRTIVLFGPETPNLYRSLSPYAISITAGLACSPCVSAFNHRKTPCRDNVCMRAITVDQVLEAALNEFKKSISDESNLAHREDIEI